MNGAALSRPGVNGDIVQEEQEASVSGQHEVKILIVHPDRLFCDVLTMALAVSPYVVIVMARVADAEELIQQETADPDVVLLGGQAGPRETYGQALRVHTRFPAARILLIGRPFVTMRSRRTRDQGRSASIPMVLGDSSFQGLLQVVHRLSRLHLSRSSDPENADPSLVKSAVPWDDGLAQRRFGLTPREVEILQLRRNGLNNKDIAVALRIGTQTVKNHVRNLSIKIGLHRVRGRQR
jgi:DNA-binding NarL/FixJ family response regulator